jgi:Zn-dependent protease
VAGIDIVVSPSWLISAAVIVLIASPVIGRVVPGMTTVTAMSVSVLLAVLLGVSVLAHELGHCLVARSMGVRVHEVRLYLVGGVSELDRPPASPKEEALIAGAGPAVSALIALLCWLLVGSVAGRSVGWLLLIELALANGIVAIFNTLPALPLDGGRVLRAGVWKLVGRRRTATRVGAAGGLVVALALLVWAALALATGTRTGLLEAAIVAVMGFFVAAGAVAEWPRRRRRSGP